jgi:hypothetical protein
MPKLVFHIHQLLNWLLEDLLTRILDFIGYVFQKETIFLFLYCRVYKKQKKIKNIATGV